MGRTKISHGITPLDGPAERAENRIVYQEGEDLYISIQEGLPDYRIFQKDVPLGQLHGILIPKEAYAPVYRAHWTRATSID